MERLIIAVVTLLKLPISASIREQTLGSTFTVNFNSFRITRNRTFNKRV